MTTKQQKYMKGLKDKGLVKFCCIIPLAAVDETRARTDKLRAEHLKELKRND
jgi:hypothetical protein